MNKSESNGRIRQVAILLSSVDAATARSLLGQLPSSQARLVRQQLPTLQNVTPAEREASLKMLAQLKHRVGNSSPASNPVKRTASSANPEASPAEALLSHVSSSIDRVEFTNSTLPTSSRPFSLPSTKGPSNSIPAPESEALFTPIQGGAEYPYQNPASMPTWQQWSGADLARLLMNERPTLIAAVLLQTPTDLSSKILESLPVATATSVLAALPQLHTTDPSVLQEIYSQLYQKLADFQRQSSPENAGLAKLHAILSVVSQEARSTFEQRLAKAEPLLAHSLGVSLLVAIDKPNDFSTNVPASVTERHSEDTNARSNSTPTIPFAPKESLADELATDLLEFDSFESLIAMSLEDFAIVLRSVDPNTVLLAASGASQTIQSRIERLVDPNEVKRLRERLKSLRSTAAREKSAAQDKIVKSAHMLLQQGRIAGLASMSMLVAA